MPMTVTVTRNRKTSQNYNSDGCGLSLTVELDQGLLGRPDELHNRIEDLYAELDRALDAESKRSGAVGSARHNGDVNHARSDPHDRHDRRDNGHPETRDRYGRRDRDHGRQAPADEPAMTHSQRRAIHAIAKRLDVDPEDEAFHQSGSSLDQLTLKQASRLIDHLKSIPRGDGNARNRRNGSGHAATSAGGAR